MGEDLTVQNENHIKVIHKMAAVLDCFEQRTNWSLTELSERLGWHVATLHRILGTLESIGYLRQNPDTRRYRLGLKLVKLGLRAAEELELPKVARPYMERLSARCGESVYLGTMQRCEVIYSEVVPANRSVRTTARIGDRRPMHSTGTGKVLLAHAPKDVVEDYLSQTLPRFTDRTLVDPNSLKAELNAIRERGYAITFQEHDEDVASIAASVSDLTGVVAALSISGPAFRLPPSTLHQLAPALLETARALSQSLGGAG